MKHKNSIILLGFFMMSLMLLSIFFVSADFKEYVGVNEGDIYTYEVYFEDIETEMVHTINSIEDNIDRCRINYTATTTSNNSLLNLLLNIGTYEDVIYQNDSDVDVDSSYFINTHIQVKVASETNELGSKEIKWNRDGVMKYYKVISIIGTLELNLVENNIALVLISLISIAFLIGTIFLIIQRHVKNVIEVEDEKNGKGQDKIKTILEFQSVFQNISLFLLVSALLLYFIGFLLNQIYKSQLFDASYLFALLGILIWIIPNLNILKNKIFPTPTIIKKKLSQIIMRTKLIEKRIIEKTESIKNDRIAKSTIENDFKNKYDKEDVVLRNLHELESILDKVELYLSEQKLKKVPKLMKTANNIIKKNDFNVKRYNSLLSQYLALEH